MLRVIVVLVSIVITVTSRCATDPVMHPTCRADRSLSSCSSRLAASKIVQPLAHVAGATSLDPLSDHALKPPKIAVMNAFGFGVGNGVEQILRPGAPMTTGLGQNIGDRLE